MSRTLNQIMAIRIRAAELNLLTCQLAEMKARAAVANAGKWRRRRLFTRWRDLSANVGLAQLHLDSTRKGTEAEEKLDPRHGRANEAELRRYAVVLMHDDPKLDPDDALLQAGRDDNTYYREHFLPAYYGAGHQH